MDVKGQEGGVVPPITPRADESEGRPEWAARGVRHLPDRVFPSCPPMPKLNGTGDGMIKRL